MQVLGDEDKRRSGAALKSMKTFVSTLLTVTHAQRRLHVDRLSAAVDGEVSGEVGGEEPSAQESSPDDGEPSATTATAAKVDLNP